MREIRYSAYGAAESVFTFARVSTQVHLASAALFPPPADGF
jgi:hypothetical protein